MYEGRIRGMDPCMECDYEPIAPVCGPNWKTYRSMCHAMECGGHKIEHVKQGACEKMVGIKKIVAEKRTRICQVFLTGLKI